MKKNKTKNLLSIYTISLLAMSALFAGALFASDASARDVHVDGYYRGNGTYVQPHYRSAPDGVKWNNKSYKGY